MTTASTMPPGAVPAAGNLSGGSVTAGPTATQREWTRSHVLILLAFVVIGLVPRWYFVGRPLDGRIVHAWRQADYYQIARNFQREGMNIFYPRIDWRADTPGFAEMELPLLPWIGAWLFRVWGEHPQLMRGLAATFELLGLLLFVWLARSLLSPAGALVAIGAYAFNPILVMVANTLQPEPLVQPLALGAVLLIFRWRDHPTFPGLLAAAAMVALAAVAKLPAACVGLVLMYVVLRTKGLAAFSDWRIYLAGALALLPPLAWSMWAHHFYTEYGLSLGVSNEHHTLTWQMLFPPTFLFGILLWETLVVASLPGWLLVVAALRAPMRRIELLLVWYAAAWIFYVAAAHTTSESWSLYYHFLSVAPVCLLMGAGFNALAGERPLPRRLAGWERFRRPVAYVLAAATLAALATTSGIRMYRRDYADTDLALMYRCIEQFRDAIPPDGRIVVRGGAMFDEHGLPLAHNESMAFAWLDRKGFNYGDEELRLDTLDAIAARGGRYWIVGRAELKRTNLRDVVAGRYRQLDTCDNAYSLFDLQSQAG